MSTTFAYFARLEKKDNRNAHYKSNNLLSFTAMMKVHNFLRNEMVSDLYEPGMTIDQAEAAARADPRVVARTVQNFLRNEMVSATEQRQAMNEIYRYST